MTTNTKDEKVPSEKCNNSIKPTKEEIYNALMKRLSVFIHLQSEHRMETNNEITPFDNDVKKIQDELKKLQVKK